MDNTKSTEKLRKKIFLPFSCAKSVILIIALTAAVYAPSLRNGFVQDDLLGIVSSPFIKSWANLPKVFSQEYLTSTIDVGGRIFVNPSAGSGESTYRPLVTLSYFFDHALWKLNPFGYHLTNLALHIINGLLFFFFLNTLTKNRTVACVASLFFTLHPVNAEAVNVISFREDLLVFCFSLCSWIFFIKRKAAQGMKRISSNILSLFFFLLALFSKETAIVLPFLLILYEGFFGGEEKRLKGLWNLSVSYAGYFVVLAFYLYVWGFVIGHAGLAASYPGGSLFTGLLSMVRIWAAYVGWFLFPINLRTILPLDPRYTVLSLLDPSFIFSALLIVILLIIAVKCRNGFKEFSFGIFWFFVALLPVSGLWPITNPIASRYLYLPMAGLCLSLAVFLSSGFLKKFKRSSVIILIVFYSLFSMIRGCVYKNYGTLLLEMAEFYPERFGIHFDLGNYFYKIGSWDSAIEEYNKALKLDARFVPVIKKLGRCYYQKGSWDEAVFAFNRAIELAPDSKESYFYMGNIFLREKKDFAAAAQHFRRVIFLDPQNSAAFNNLGLAMIGLKEWARAKEIFEKCLKIDAACEECRRNLDKLRLLEH